MINDDKNSDTNPPKVKTADEHNTPSNEDRYESAQQRSIDGMVKAQPQDPAEVSDPTEKRIEYLRAKSDRTLEEGLELEELELGVEKSKEINAGRTSDQIDAEQDRLRAAEKAVEAENEDK